jgi:hypothetical protein
MLIVAVRRFGGLGAAAAAVGMNDTWASGVVFGL